MLRRLVGHRRRRSADITAVASRLEALDREIAALRATAGAGLRPTPGRLVAVRCECTHCGAHLRGTLWRAALAGQCPNCGGREIVPVPGVRPPLDRSG